MDAVGTTGVALQLAVTIFKALQTVKNVADGNSAEPMSTMKTLAGIVDRDCADFLQTYESATAETTIQNACTLARQAQAVSAELMRKLDKIGPERRNAKTFTRALFHTLWSKKDLEDLQTSLNSCMEALGRFRAEKGWEELDAQFKKSEEALTKQLDQLHAQSDTMLALQAGALRKAEDERTAQRDRKIAEMLLKALDFEGMGYRYGEVNVAEKDTFRWIFEPKTSSAYSEVSVSVHFSEWLARGDGIFHIAGKPGSGKSTLMKFIVESPETATQLQQWAAGRTLVQASCFFWKPGNVLQRSMTGLIRTLLHETIQATPAVAGALFPDVWREPGTEKKLALKLSDASIQAAFQRLVDGAGGLDGDNVRYCFFIDGLDEYGKANESIPMFVGWLKRMACQAGGRVKFCVSSREYPEIEDKLAVDGAHRVTLQDLTSDDIALFVDSRLREALSANEYTDGVGDGDGDDILKQKDIAELCETIVNRAEGVFLWVALVLGMVESEAGIGAPVGELVRLVSESQNDDLDAFFGQIVDRVPKHNRRKVAIMFKFALAQMRVGHGADNLFWYIFVKEYTTADTFSWQCDDTISQMPTMDALEKRAVATEKWIKRNCEGLLSLIDTRHPVTKRSVALTHRSITEFLTELVEGQWKHELSGFDVTTCVAHLAVVYATLHSADGILQSTAMGYDSNHILRFYFQSLVEIIDSGSTPTHQMNWSFELVTRTEQMHPEFFDVAKEASFTSCHEYLQWRNQLHPGWLVGKDGSYLANVIDVFELTGRASATVRQLFDGGISVWSINDGHAYRLTAWTYLVINIRRRDPKDRRVLLEVLELFLQAAGDEKLPVWVWFGGKGSTGIVHIQGHWVRETDRPGPRDGGPFIGFLGDVLPNIADVPGGQALLDRIDALEPVEKRRLREERLLQDEEVVLMKWS